MKNKLCLLSILIFMMCTYVGCSKKIQTLTPNSEQDTLTKLYENENQAKKKLVLNYIIQAKQKINTQQYAQAELKLLKALEINEYRHFTDYYLAHTFYKLGRYTDSLAYIDKTEDKFSSYPNYRYYLMRLKADNFVKMNKTTQALKNYRTCLNMHSDDEYVKEKIRQLEK